MAPPHLRVTGSPCGCESPSPTSWFALPPQGLRVPDIPTRTPSSPQPHTRPPDMGAPGPASTQAPCKPSCPSCGAELPGARQQRRPTDLNRFLMVLILLRGTWSRGALPHLGAGTRVRGRALGVMATGEPTWGARGPASS